MTRRRLQLILLYGLAFAVLFVLAYLSGANRFAVEAENRKAGHLLQMIRRTEAEWSRELLRIDAGVYKSFDGISDPLHLIKTQEQQLHALVQEMDDAALGQSMLSLMDVNAQREELTESYKTEAALANISKAYLAMAEDAMDTRLRALYPGRHPEHAHNYQFHQLKDIVSHLMLKVLRNGGDAHGELEETVQSQLAKLREMQEKLPAPLAEQASHIADHVANLVEHGAQKTLLLQKIARLPAQERTDAVSQALEVALEKRMHQGDIWRVSLLVYAAAMLVLLVITGWRLRMSYVAQRSTNRALEQLNNTLEQKVSMRTHDLREALDQLRSSQVQLVQAEKLSVIGQLVAGIAHEVNTPLAYVKTNTELLEDRMRKVMVLARMLNEVVDDMRNADVPEEELAGKLLRLQERVLSLRQSGLIREMHEMTRDVGHGVHHITEIVENLKNLSRMDHGEITCIQINDLLDSALRLARGTLGRRTIRRHYGELPLVEGMPTQISQVLLNLITNAAQATSAREGIITLTTTPQGQGVEVAVTDNGTGIAAEDMEHIFDPFFTTKPAGQGTGLGLAVAQGILQRHGGSIRVQSQQGLGSTFTIFLPLKMPAAADQAAVSGFPSVLTADTVWPQDDNTGETTT